MSGLSMRHSFAAGPYGVRGSDPDRSYGLEALREIPVLPAPSSMTSCPSCCLSSSPPGPGSPADHAFIQGRIRRARYSVPGSHAAAAIAAGVRSSSRQADRARIMRAILFASATATSFGGFPAIILASRESFRGSDWRRCPVTAVAPGTSSCRRSRCRILVIRPGSCRPAACCSRGVSPTGPRSPGHGGSSPSAGRRHGRPWHIPDRCREWSSAFSSPPARAPGCGSAARGR